MCLSGSLVKRVKCWKMYAEAGLLFPYFQNFSQEVQQLEEYCKTQKCNASMVLSVSLFFFFFHFSLFWLCGFVWSSFVCLVLNWVWSKFALKFGFLLFICVLLSVCFVVLYSELSSYCLLRNRDKANGAIFVSVISKLKL